MARGTIYHIYTDFSSAQKMDESDFYDKLDILGADYVENEAPHAAAASTNTLMASLHKHGFRVEKSCLPDIAFVIGSVIQQKLSFAKQNWFSNSKKALEQVVQNITLDEFASNQSVADRIRDLADNSHGDIIYLDTGYGPSVYSLDRFIREMQPDTEYLVAENTVFMH